MAENMVGPVMRALMRHLAAENAAVDRETAHFASNAVAELLREPWAEAVGRRQAALGDAEGGEVEVALTLQREDTSSIPTPVVRFGAPEAMVALAPFVGEAEPNADGGGDAARDVASAGGGRGTLLDPPEIDDDFELPPPAIDISIDFGELFPLGAAALIGDDLAAGVTPGQPPATGAADARAAIAIGLATDGDAAALAEAGPGDQQMRGIAGSDGESTPDMPWTAPHTHRNSQPSTPRVVDEADRESHSTIKDEDLTDDASLGGHPTAAMEASHPDTESIPKGDVPAPPRIIGERALQLVADLEVFRMHEVLKAMWERWSEFARTMRLKRRLEVAAAFGVALGPPPQPTTQRHCPPHVVVHVRPTGVARVPVGCCQAVRVGRRRVAAQRASRPAAVIPVGRRCAPCGGATAPRR
mmetsp:Transcript_3143/g.9025  ORF Transcript_3143/g.9025 Transcript_3143/m.9025 type:complete len:415 (-) Transcript_3143:353-1597(-)